MALVTITNSKYKAGNYEVFSTASAVYVSGDFKNNVYNANDAKNAVLEVSDKFNISNTSNQLYYDRTIKLPYGLVYKFKQLHQGFFVYARSLSVVVDDNGEVLSITGNIDGAINLNIEKNLLEPNLKNALVDFDDYSILSTEMVVYQKNNDYYFCYNLTIQTSSLYAVMIDAYTGNLVDVLPLESSLSNLPTSGYTITQEEIDQTDAFSNNVSVTMEKYIAQSGSDTFYLLADSSKNIYMADINNKQSYSGYEYYISDDGVIEDSIAVTAYINLINSYDFYFDYFGLEGIDGKDEDGNTVKITLTALVHFHTDYNNAAYAYTTNSTSHYFIFGDGDRADGYDYFAKGLDVVGHEYTHAITRSIVDFKYLNESGALSEAYSDMFGALIEAEVMGYDFSNIKFWAIGENLRLNAGECIRNLKDPKITHYSNKIADCYDGHDHDDINSTCDRGGVHSNCQIFTYAVYKMYESGVFTDLKSMADLLYASLVYLSADATLIDSKIALLQAAEHLGISDDKIDKIELAFYEVGVGIETSTYYFYSGEDAVGTDETPIEIISEIGSVVSVPECTFEKQGYYFLYWTNSNGDILDVGDKLTIGSGDAVYYAVWTNQQLSKISGKGNVIDPYLIEDLDDLKTMAYYINNNAYKGKYNNARFSLQANINFKNQLWEPIGTKENPFNGTFLGGSYELININLNASSDVEYNGLFGYVGSSGYITDVIIESGAIVSEASYTGSIVGFLEGTIVTCRNNVNISSTKTAGGLVGLAKANGGSSIEDCYNTADIVANVAGGLVGHAYSSLIEYADASNKMYLSGYVVNSYNTGIVQGEIAGGICGEANGYNFINCINNGNVDGLTGVAGGMVGLLTNQDMISAPLVLPSLMVYAGVFSAKSSAAISGLIKGSLIGNIQCGNSNAKIYLQKNTTKQGEVLVGNQNSFTTNETDTILLIDNIQTLDSAMSGDFDYDNIEFYLNDTWTTIAGFTGFNFVSTWTISDGNMPVFNNLSIWWETAHYFTGFGYEAYGYGSESKPYEISSAEQLSGLSFLVSEGNNFAGKYFKLTADIDLSGKLWVGIGTMKRAAADLNSPFSGNFDGNGHVIKNLQGTTLGFPVEDEDYTDGYRTEMWLGSLFGITAPYIANNKGVYTTYIPTIKNVVLQNANVTGLYAAGLVGVAFSSINLENCFNIDGKVSAMNFAGGLISYIGNNDTDLSYTRYSNQNSVIKNCYSNAEVSGFCVGGIVGYCENISNTYSQTIEFINCVNAGNMFVYGIDKYDVDGYDAGAIGGILGSSSAYKASFINCIFAGNAYAYNADCAVGGIVGTLGEKIYNQTALSFLFIGCKVSGLLKNYANDDATNLAALIGSAISTDIETANVKALSSTHYLTKYDAFGNNLSGNKVSSNSSNGKSDTAFNFSEENYFKSSLFATAYEFNKDIVNLLSKSSKVTITFKVNGETVKVEQVDIGQGVDSFIPVREATPYYEYNFLYWDDNFGFVTEDKVINAVFEQVKRSYTIVYKDGDYIYATVKYDAGSKLKNEPLAGKNPYKVSDFFYDYTFAGWDYSGDILSDMEVNAVYHRSMKLQGAIFLIGLLLLIFLLPVVWVIKSHFKKNNYR